MPPIGTGLPTERWPTARLGEKSFGIFRPNGPPESKSDSLERLAGWEPHHLPAEGQIDSVRRKTALASVSVETLRQSRLIMVDVTTREFSASEKQGRVPLSCCALSPLSRPRRPHVPPTRCR